MNCTTVFSHVLARVAGAIAGGVLACVPLAASADSSSQHEGHVSTQQVAMPHQTPAWAEKLKGQTVVEDTMEGRPERAAMVERQHQRIMFQMGQDAQMQHTDGMYNNMSMMHQYGAGGQDMLLVSDPRTEPVSMQGGSCPAYTSVKSFY